VAILGCGAVGGFAAENLVRNGIGALTLVDFDQITATNLNRQLTALHSTLGQMKVAVLAQRLLDINPQLKLQTFQRFIDETSLPELLAPPFDYVVDAIDSFSPKLKLLVSALERGLPIISSMGAAGRLNPREIRWGWLSTTQVCPLARRLRKGLHRLGKTGDAIMTVFSTEIPFKPLAPDVAHEESTFTQGRKRSVNGSISYIPAIFGSLIAAVVLNAILEERRVPAFCCADDSPQIFKERE
jgi:tRNA A37 threonylcarbamoyladenosine dehydratase